MSINSIVQNNEKTVYHQLAPDFPGPAIEWVKKTIWIGPLRIPLEAIDVSNRQNWVASYEPKKVQVHQKLIMDGQSAPIILGAFPGHNKFYIIDAHHRFLAYEALKQEPLCWIGQVPPDLIEAAMTAHSRQFTGSSRLAGPNDQGKTNL